MTNATLNNGIEMPMLGMGTWPLNGLKLAILIRRAIRLGYRSFDLASAYGNEKWFGRGLRISGHPRQELFITTKLSNAGQRSGDIRGALQKSLSLIGIKYLDLYLIHWPVPNLFVSSWKQMELLYKEGLIRAIGVCNFHQHHLKSLLECTDVVPAVNQVELHPLLSQVALVKFCRDRNIQVEAYTPLARMHDKLIKNENLIAIAKHHNKTVPQIILRWDFQQGVMSIPKSSHFLRLKENIGICDFQLSDEEVDLINRLNIDFRVRYDPDNCRFTR